MSAIPEGVIQETDGFFYKDGQRYCEDCWQPIPRYVDFPLGLVSPESDGDHGGNFGKYKMASQFLVENPAAHLIRHPLRKAVCLDCYNSAFQRFYPGAALPELSRMVRETTQFLQPEPVVTPVFVPDPMAARR